MSKIVKSGQVRRKVKEGRDEPGESGVIEIVARVSRIDASVSCNYQLNNVYVFEGINQILGQNILFTSSN